MENKKLSVQQVEHLAYLARLEISEKEKEQYARQLSTILEYVSQLKEVSGRGEAFPPELANVWREDKVIPCGISREELLANAPQVEEGLVKVPRILE